MHKQPEDRSSLTNCGQNHSWSYKNCSSKKAQQTTYSWNGKTHKLTWSPNLTLQSLNRDIHITTQYETTNHITELRKNNLGQINIKLKEHFTHPTIKWKHKHTNRNHHIQEQPTTITDLNISQVFDDDLYKRPNPHRNHEINRTMIGLK